MALEWFRVAANDRLTSLPAGPFSAVDQAQLSRWLEDANKSPPTLFKRYRWDRRELVRMVGSDGALAIEHVCEVFQLWSDGHEARMRRLRYAVDPRGAISADGEFSLIEPSGKAGKRTNQTVVAIVDFLVPVFLALGVPWSSTTSGAMTRALDLVAVGLFGLPGTKSELQKRMRDHRAHMTADRAAIRSFASQLVTHKESFVGPPISHELRQKLIAKAWTAMPRETRAAILASVARGLEAFKIQPPSDIRPSR